MRHHKVTWDVIVCRDYWIKCSIYLYPLTSVHSRSVAVLSVILVINLRNSLLTRALPVLVVATLQIPHTVVLNFDTVPEAAITCEQQNCSTKVTILKVTNKSILSPWLWDTIWEWTGNVAKLCHSTSVCVEAGLVNVWHVEEIMWAMRASWPWSTSPGTAAVLVGSATPTK